MSDAYTQKWMTLVPERVYLSVGSGHLTAADMQTFDWEFTNMIEASSAPMVHLIAEFAPGSQPALAGGNAQ